MIPEKRAKRQALCPDQTHISALSLTSDLAVVGNPIEQPKKESNNNPGVCTLEWKTIAHEVAGDCEIKSPRRLHVSMWTPLAAVPKWLMLATKTRRGSLRATPMDSANICSCWPTAGATAAMLDTARQGNFLSSCFSMICDALSSLVMFHL